jgi:hypothetical protein
MNKLLFSLMLIFVSGNAAAEWTLVGGRGNDSTAKDYSNDYLDLNTIRKTGNIVKVWGVEDFNSMQNLNGSNYLSDKALFEYDCKEESFRTLSFTLYSGHLGTDKVVSLNNFIGDWTPIVPESIAEAKWKVVCGK